MEDEEVGSYASFVARVGRASSEIRETEGTTGDSFIGRGNNIVDSSTDDDENMLDETTIIVERGQSEDVDDEQTLLADKTTLVIPPDEIQGFLRERGLNSRPRTGFKVKEYKGQFLCPICEHPFKRRNNAQQHTYTHMNEEELGRTNIYYQRCPHSPQKIFFDRQNYADHINSHEGIKNFKCQICRKGFSKKGYLQYHMFTHENEGSVEGQTPFRHLQCYFCHKKIVSMSKLIVHLCVHTKETPFKCSYCNKWFKKASNMRSHIRRIHSHPDNPIPFPCPQCPKKYHERGRLTQHIKTAHGEKLHNCSACSKSFSAKGNLDIHVDGVHRKIRHHCPQCPKSYSRKTDMNTHMRKEHS